MLSFVHKFSFVILWCMVFISLGCRSGEPIAEPIQPEETPVIIEEAIAIETEEPVAVDSGNEASGQTALPTEIEAEPSPATELPTEISESISPILPESPIETPALKTQDIQPLAGSEPVLIAAKTALAERVGVAQETISLVSMEKKEWSDASLGCPQEGYMYAQVITPGYLMVLEAAGTPYTYHTDETQNVVLCEQ